MSNGVTIQKKIRLCVLFGGRSAEHEVSIISARSMIDSLDFDRYELLLVGIDHDGCWANFEANKYLHRGKLKEANFGKKNE